MTVEHLLASFRRLAPAGCCIAGGEVSIVSEKFFPHERTYLNKVGNGLRRLQFQAGRFYAREALQAVGCSSHVLPRGKAGPIWPDGYCGSITHSGSLCLVAVAPVKRVLMLGIDLEQATAFPESSRPLILSPEEQAQSSYTNECLAKIFVIKEASYKFFSGLGLIAPELRAMRTLSLNSELFEVRATDNNSGIELCAQVHFGAAYNYFFAIATALQKVS